jgi:hypothetical protein
MNKNSTRSSSTNARIKIPRQWDESSLIQKSLIIPKSEKSFEKVPKIKLPKLDITASKISTKDTPSPSANTEETISNLKVLLENEWNAKKIPLELQQSFSRCVWTLPRHKVILIISREIEDLKYNRSPMQAAIRAVTAREESLNSIHEMNSYLKEVSGWEKMKEVQLECAELLHAHRILTISAIESIGKWRDLILFSTLINHEANNLHMPFIWNEENYLMKLKTDLDFLVTSEFSKAFNFSLNDPLLIKPSQVLVKIKEKKIDHNYFIQHGQVVVSLPSSLKSKVDSAEEVISKEFLLESRLKPAQVEEISNVIYEELCEEEATNEIQDYLNNNRPEFIQNVMNHLIDQEIYGLCNDIVNENYLGAKREVDDQAADFLIQDFIDKELQSLVQDTLNQQKKSFEHEKKENLVKQQRKKEEDASLARIVYNDLFNDIIQIMLQQEIEKATVDAQELENRYQKAKLDKQNQEIAEKIRNDCIEALINEVTVELSNDIMQQQSKKNVSNAIYYDLLNELIQETVSETYNDLALLKESKKNQYLNNLSEQIYNSLLDMLSIDLSILGKDLLNDPEQLFSDRNDIFENLGLEFGDESVYSGISGVEFKRINIPEAALIQVIDEYYPKIPVQELSVTLEEEKLEEMAEQPENKWHWALIKNYIVGLLVFSSNIDRDDINCINIHHLTSLNWAYYPHIIESACNFIWKSDNCQEIRINLYIKGDPEVPLNIKKVVNSQKFKWKTNIKDDNEDFSVVVMGKSRPVIKMKESNNIKKLLLQNKK